MNVLTSCSNCFLFSFFAFCFYTWYGTEGTVLKGFGEATSTSSITTNLTLLVCLWGKLSENNERKLSLSFLFYKL